MKKYLRIGLEVLLVILLVASSTFAYLNFSGKKHLSIDMEEVAAELDETKDTLDKTKEQLEDAQKKTEALEETAKQFDVVKQAFANGVLLQDIEALYKAQKVLNAERLVGLGTVRQLSKGFEDASAVEAFQKSLDIAELGARMQAVCAAQNSLVSAGKKVKVLAECTGKLEKPIDHGKSAKNVHWGYEGDHGPEHWGENFATCAAGKKQSPLNIVGPFEKSKEVVKADYKESSMKILNNGHTIQVNIEPGTGTLTVNKEQYELLQFHFHRPSEEQVDGKNLAMTVHFVHKSKEGKLAVLGVLMNEGKENATIKSLWANLPPKEGEEYLPAKMIINPSSLLPSDMSFFSYEGSLTTPPCTEGVSFFILKNNVDLSKAQVAKFPFKLNARPVQALNDRKIYAN
ncbi:MAG: carbonic anhydrase family protein [Burkholderiaceae bacterium]